MNSSSIKCLMTVMAYSKVLFQNLSGGIDEITKELLQ